MAAIPHSDAKTLEYQALNLEHFQVGSYRYRSLIEDLYSL